MQNKNRVLAALAWCWDKIVDNWLGIIFIAGSGSLTAYLAAVTEFLQPYSPISWVLLALLSALIVAVVFALYGFYRSRVAHARFEERRSATPHINPLSDNFERVPIRLSDFYHPFYRITKAARFKGCDLFGPAMIYTPQCTISNCTWVECDFVLITEKSARSTTAIRFLRCVFEGCSFYRVMVAVTPSMYHTLSKDVGHSPLLLAGTEALASGKDPQ
jgi:hypothetical protein